MPTIVRIHIIGKEIEQVAVFCCLTSIITTYVKCRRETKRGMAKTRPTCRNNKQDYKETAVEDTERF